MKIAIQTIGNSKGIVLPKRMLAQVGLDDQRAAEVSVERGAIVLRMPRKPLRSGWAEAARRISSNDEGVLLMDGFSNAQDAELTW